MLGRPNWKELAGQAVVTGHALTEELKREKLRTSGVLELLEDDSVDPRIRIARARVLLKCSKPKPDSENERKT